VAELANKDDEVIRERVRRRAVRSLRMLLMTAGGEPPVTPDLSEEQLAVHARHLVTELRVVIETWRRCGGAVPQQLSEAIRCAKRAVWCAAGWEEHGDA
jgi:hypothetical protein